MPREEKKSEEEVTERGVERSLDDWEDYAKIFRRKSEQEAMQAEQAGAGMGVGQLEILGLLEKLGASSGAALNEELVKKARMIEMETCKKLGVYKEVPEEECWKVTGKKPIGVR